jgi:hypothetical protein
MLKLKYRKIDTFCFPTKISLDTDDLKPIDKPKYNSHNLPIKTSKSKTYNPNSADTVLQNGIWISNRMKNLSTDFAESKSRSKLSGQFEKARLSMSMLPDLSATNSINMKTDSQRSAIADDEHDFHMQENSKINFWFSKFLLKLIPKVNKQKLFLKSKKNNEKQLSAIMLSRRKKMGRFPVLFFINEK